MAGIVCRRNAATLSTNERTAFVQALLDLEAAGGFQRYADIHAVANWAGHSGPAFFPWHREFLRRLERDLQSINQAVSLPYWDFTSANFNSSTNSSLIWTADLMGGPGNASGNVTDGPFAGWGIRRNSFSPQAIPLDPSHVTSALNTTGYNNFEPHLEHDSHDTAHVFIGGNQTTSFRHAPRDPIFFLLHSNVDRIWSLWMAARRREWLAANPGMNYPATQPAQDYFYDGSTPARSWPSPDPATGHQIDDSMWPWNGNSARTIPGNPGPYSFPPWNAPSGAQIVTPRSILNHWSLGYIYDTDPPVVTLETPSLSFLDIPAGETTVRAIVFRVVTCQPAHFEIVSGPTGGFGTPLGATATLAPPASFTDAVRIWISYTGTVAGDSATGTVTVRCVETTEQWTVPIAANTVQRPTVASVMVLDQSGSMDWDSGIPGRARIDVLRSSAPIFVDVMPDNDAVGIVKFDHDAYPVMPVTPAGPPIFGPGRATASASIAAHTANPAGATSIGDGVELAHNTLAPVTGYDAKAMIVFTDGFENSEKYIAQVAGLISERVFAIGLGTAEQINPVALNALANGTGGYLLMTGAIGPTDIFRLSKYFLQILAGVTNTDVVVDPESALRTTVVERIPFSLTEADISTDVLLLSPAPWAFNFTLEAPDGSVIDRGSVAGLAGIHYIATPNVHYYRATLPVPIGAGAREGLWYAELSVSDGNFREYLATLRNDEQQFQRARVHGVPYSLSVHAYSNVRLGARLTQSSMEPGATLTLRALLSEYGLPVAGRAGVVATLAEPDGNNRTLVLQETSPGMFETSTTMALSGVYPTRIIARGTTLQGRSFTREQLLTAMVWRGGDDRPPRGQGDTEDARAKLCALIDCILDRESLGGLLERSGVEPEFVRRCLRKICSGRFDLSI